MTYSCERHDSFIGEVTTHPYVRHDSSIWEPWLIHTRDMTHSYVRHESFMCETRRLHKIDMNHSNERPDSCIWEECIFDCAVEECPACFQKGIYLHGFSIHIYKRALKGVAIFHICIARKCVSFLHRVNGCGEYHKTKITVIFSMLFEESARCSQFASYCVCEYACQRVYLRVTCVFKLGNRLKW